MEPQANNPEQAANNNPERSPQTPEIAASPDQARKLEHLPVGAFEQLNESATEKGQVSSNSLQATASDIATLPTLQPTPLTDGGVVDDNTATPVPAAAADEDVIEKEWVDKAKKVINQTKGDPYAKEKEVSRLQADYMQKRYGKQVKMPDET